MERHSIGLGAAAIALVFASLSCTAAVGGELDEAQLAVRRHDYTRAAQLFEHLARKGNAEAQYNLGVRTRSARLGRPRPWRSRISGTIAR